MSVRKRVWITGKGVEKTAWVVDYTDTKGKRRLKTFSRKKDADSFHSTAHVEVREGVHVADRETVTVGKAGAFWITSGEAAGLERSTINQRKQHLRFHIEPLIGETLLSKVTVPAVRAFEDALREEGRSSAMIKKIVGSLGSILSDAQERGLATRNPVRDMRGTRKGKETRLERRKKRKLEVGVDIPTPHQIRVLIDALEGRWRPLLITAIFTGMRSSELRGLCWRDVDLRKSQISVTQRADGFGEIGAPKSNAGKRTIPVPKAVIDALKEWRWWHHPGRNLFEDPQLRPEEMLVFPNGNLNPESHANIINRGLIPAMIRAQIVTPDGKPRFTGLHALRHFYASWLINSREDGGLGLPPKVVQERLGHSSITMTYDTYGHLFPRGDDNTELEEAALALLT